MTPAIDLARKSGVAHQVLSYTHDPQATSYGNEAVEKLNLPAEQVFKTLVVNLDSKQLAVAVLPVSGKLSLKSMAKTLGAKKADMADKAQVEKVTGYVLGGVSPLGQKKQLKTVIDISACSYAAVYVSAGRRGLEIAISPDDLSALTGAVFASIQSQA
ncbi:Cys-tRNA(Pro) deacylase [Nitrincola iocasae]|uniref:Cys-tRNA(Pro)/Cys-tRNA(Cys) deacylase n=1 Tax=Nitrincola iocasae TaxID=2614693 RepID=A0A5J6LD27_9GAMM|nr:Cys-tRNA(Pro) deacylase [Nitrincola iocasae]QEW06373.1 Cys-tRNA(Pro) deacylase [Nitrincola iocasae]